MKGKLVHIKDWLRKERIAGLKIYIRELEMRLSRAKQHEERIQIESDIFNAKLDLDWELDRLPDYLENQRD